MAISELPGPDAFWSKVDMRGPDDCWLWQASVTGSGYGQFWHTHEGKRRRWNTHRLLATWLWGHPGSLDVSHTCEGRYALGDNRARLCLNPAHLRLVTHKENMQDLRRTGRQRTAVTPAVEKTIIEMRLARAPQAAIAAAVGVSVAAVRSYLRANKLDTSERGRRSHAENRRFF